MKKIRAFPFFIATTFLITGCSQLHVHDYSSSYSYNETEHWQICSKCHEKINFESHSFNVLNDTCLVCSYKDPVCIKNDKNHLTGLTKYGMTKTEVNVPNGITFIDSYAFKGSKVSTVNLSKDIIGIYKDAFAESEVTVINTEEEVVRWVEYNGIYYKDDVLKNYEAMIDNKLYTSFKDAVANVQEHNTIITLLKNIDYSKEEMPISIKYQITLESYIPNCVLKTNFYITPGGSIKIPKDVTYQGSTILAFGDFNENIGESSVLVKNSGSLIFSNRTEEEKPEGVDVQYFDTDTQKYYEAVGSVQTFNEAIVIPKPYYSYGVFKLSTDLKKIMGLTTFGEKVMGLNVTNVIKDQPIEINNWAFTKPATIKIHIPVRDIRIRVHQQKGFYRHATIGAGVTSIGEYAFSNYFDHTQVPREALEYVTALVCPLTTLIIGDSVKTINFRAFYYCAGLKSVTAGMGLEEICQGAFDCCYALETADFVNSIKLTKIGSYAFSLDDHLTELRLPSHIGWKADDCGFLPEDILPSKAAHVFSSTYKDKVWTRNINAKVCFYNPLQKDDEGRCNKVFYTNTFDEALNNCEENGVIVLCHDADTVLELGDLNLTKNVRIDTVNKAKIGNVNIAQGKYLKLNGDFEFNEGAHVHLKTNTDGTLYKDVAGFAITHNSNVDKLPTVDYFHNGSNYSAKSSIATLNDGIGEYDCYGLFDFNLSVEKTTPNLTIRWLSALGNIATKFVVGDPLKQDTANKIQISFEESDGAFKGHSLIQEVTLDDDVCKVHRDSFLNCKSLETIKFGKNIDYIGRWAFCGCEKLVNVSFDNENKVLTKIDKGAFTGCKSLENFSLPNQKLPLNIIGQDCFSNTNLKTFDFTQNTGGWKHAQTSILEEDLKNKETAALYLAHKYSSETFSR